MKHPKGFAAASVALLAAMGATFLLAGSAHTPGESNLSVVNEAPAPAAFAVVAEANAHPKQTAIVPASSPKLTAQTTVKPAESKADALPLSGESTAMPAPPASKILNAPNLVNDVAFSRRNPVIEAVKKTKNAIVQIRVPRPHGAKDMIGTGVIVDPRGFIVTNRHVVADAKSIAVVLADDTKIAAELVIGDPRVDLAILRVRSGKTLASLPLGPADDLMVGETVIAVGNPFGYTHSVSTGIISALNRDITMPTGDVLTGLIQTNASINPGNSGGPLLNINGEFIGVNVALRDGAQNIAFSINAGTVRSFLRQHLSAARVSSIQHGLRCSDKTLAETGHRQQVIVSWFQGAGDLCAGDELISIGARRVLDTFDVERAFWGRKAGESVALKIVRHGQEMHVSLTVAASSGAGQSVASLPRAVSQPAGTPVAAAADHQR